MNNTELLREKAYEGLEEKGLIGNKEYEDRLKFELATVEEQGFVPYFLIMWDIAAYARKNGILYGPGRGSGAGSLLNYCLKITLVDPIKYGLYFERFLNPSRVSPPDIDWDCAERDRIIEYLEKRYGSDRVARVGSLNFLRTKSAIRDVGRVLGKEYPFIEELANLVPPPVAGLWDSFAAECEVEPKLRDNRYSEIIGPVEKLWGVVRSYGTHAGGVAIAPGPINRFVPLYKDKDGQPVSQFDWRDLEAVGLLKFDILGLNTLEVIQLCLDYIREGGHDVNLESLEDEDKATYDVICSGALDGIFQLGGSESIKQLTVQVAPRNIEDLSMVTSLFRPGPLSSGMVDDAVAIRQGKKEEFYVHPNLEKILKPTHCICVFHKEDILTPEGSKAIDEIHHGDIIFDGTGTPRSVKVCQMTGHKGVSKYTVDSGHSIRVTPDHRVRTLDGWAEAADASHFLRIRATRQAKYKYVHPDLAWLTGLYISDGCLNTSSPVISVGQDEAKADLVGTILESQFKGTKTKYFHTRSWYVGLKRPKGTYRNELNEWLRELGLFRKSGLDKNIPTEAARWTDESLYTLLGGMFDGDGHVGKSITYSSASGLIHDQLGYILDVLRISWYRCGHLTVIRDTELFAEKVGPFLKFKDADLIERSCFGDLTIAASYCKEYIDEVRAGQPIQTFLKKNGIPRSFYYSKSPFRKVRTFASHFPERALDLKHKVRGLYSPQRVLSSEDLGKQEVWDLQVDGPYPAFIADHIVIHNCVFQEQVMRICTDLCGYTLPEADTMRKILGKKMKKEMKEQKPKFVGGAIANGVPEEDAQKLFLQLQDYAQYLFNKAHAVAYSFITYWTAYLKAHYPVEFYAALLACETKPDMVTQYVSSAKDNGIEILPPDINESGVLHRPEGSAIRFGLGHIKGMPRTTAEEIVRLRNQ